ncbi:MAG: EAL domain-containing protein, partial [Treponema sp.]|nr:EAL domain-containing protein [Treponema sp.]
MKDEKQIFNKIIEGGFITPVYQPIISLTEGHVFGYEAISKIPVKELKMDISQIFRQADKLGKAWELEVICRTKALKNFTPINREMKLFLKVNPNVINDDEFKEGFTRECLSKYGLDFNNIIFEITERTAIYDKNIFLDSILHYRKQKYEIAIDDVGAGYSGLNTIAAIRPNYVKLDKNLIKDIDKDETKQFLCKAMVDFCKNSDIIVLAKGIDTVEELKTLIKLNVDLGQGYFFGIPQEFLIDIEPEKSEMIKSFHTKKYIEKTRSTTYPIIGYLSKKGICFHPDEKINNIFDNVKASPIITDFTIVEDDIAVGFMSRAELNELLGGQYGYSL